MIGFSFTREEAEQLHNLLTRWGENAAHDAVQSRLFEKLYMNVDPPPETPPHIHPGQTTVEEQLDSIHEQLDSIHDYIDPATVRGHGRT